MRAVLWDLRLGDARLCATGSPRSVPGELPAGVWSPQPAASCPDSLQSPHGAPGAGPFRGDGGGAGSERNVPLRRRQRGPWRLRGGTDRAGSGRRCRPPPVPVLKMAPTGTSTTPPPSLNMAASRSHAAGIKKRNGCRFTRRWSRGLTRDSGLPAAPLLCSCSVSGHRRAMSVQQTHRCGRRGCETIECGTVLQSGRATASAAALSGGERRSLRAAESGADPGGFAPSIESKFGLQGRRGLPHGAVRWGPWGIHQFRCSICPWLRGASPVSFTLHP